MRGLLMLAAVTAFVAVAGAQTGGPLQDAARRALARRDQTAGAEAGVRVSPGQAQLGERLHYRGWVLVAPGAPAHFEAPETTETIAWADVRQGRTPLKVMGAIGGPTRLFDSVWIEAGVQLFATGPQRVPGVAVQIEERDGVRRGRLPSAAVTILPVLAAADSNAQLRPVRGPLAAPWWERVPWRVVLVALALLALAVWLVRRLRRRRPAPVAAPAAAPAARRRPALEEALAALAALRAEKLPGRGAFGEHALRLTRLLRVYLERTAVAARPGDTSGELLDRLRGGAVLPDDLDQLGGLLGVWDRVKFARAPLTAAEAERAEAAVEAFLKRHAGVPGREVA